MDAWRWSAGTQATRGAHGPYPRAEKARRKGRQSSWTQVPRGSAGTERRTLKRIAPTGFAAPTTNPPPRTESLALAQVKTASAQRLAV